ncbi:hypothetical protein EDD22DRAFT_949745 [Suillus occidentalis]|nr:hypothetical protein EDD22DRAFT_949745 [Suillus occidentalis]
MSTVNDSASGLDKGQVYTTLAKLILMDHPKYGHAYATNTKKFREGTGVMSDGGTQMKNLLDAALIELPWHTELDAIWHINLSMAAKTHSSKPGVNHADTFFSLVKLRNGAGPPTHLPPTLSHLLMHIPCITLILPIFRLHTKANNTLQDFCQQCLMLEVLVVISLLIQHCNNLVLLAHFSLPPPLYNWSPHLPGLPALDDDDDDDNMDIQETSLGDTFHHLKGDEGGNFSKAAGKKRQLPSSPSPSPEPPESFAMPAKSPISVYNSFLAFGSKKPSSYGRHRRLPSEVSVSTSAPSSTMHNTSLLDYLMSSTPHTLLPNSASGSKKKKTKSDVI